MVLTSGFSLALGLAFFVILLMIIWDQVIKRDIRARMNQLQESERQYRRLVEEARDGVFIMTFDGRLSFVNEHLAEMIGFSREELIGKCFKDLVPPMLYEAAASEEPGEDGGRLREESGLRIYDICVAGKDGRERWLQVNPTLIHQGGPPYAIQGIVRDITRQKQLERELVRQTEEARRMAGEMASLYQIGLATTSTLDLAEVLDVIYREISQLMDAPGFFIALYNHETNEISFEILIDNGKRIPSFRVSPGENAGFTGKVIFSNQVIFIPDLLADQSQLPKEAKLTGDTERLPRSVIVVPLVFGGKAIGALSVQSYSTVYTENELRLVSTIGIQAAIAIENARLYTELKEKNTRLQEREEELRLVNQKLDEQLAEVTRLHKMAEQLAITDPVTGLYNHRYFQERLDYEIERAIRYARYLSLVMIDIDDFKKYNDSYGHQAGDGVLKMVAREIKRAVRNTDIVARYGGEEFVVILLEADSASAMVVAEKIRKRIESCIFPISDKRSGGKITVSLGVSTFPDDAKTKRDLIEFADMAMYAGKQEGGNRSRGVSAISDRIQSLKDSSLS